MNFAQCHEISCFFFWTASLNHRYQWYKPSSVLALDTGHIFILENDRIQIFDELLNPISYKMGHFYGLTAGENDEVSVSIVFPLSTKCSNVC